MGYRTIVVGTDGSVTANAAQRAAVTMAKRTKARVVLVCGWDPARTNRPLAEQTLRRAEAAVRRENVDVQAELLRGEPAELILKTAERHGADLIVVGNKGMSGARRILLGSVPNNLAHYAPTDVLIVKTVDLSLDDVQPGHGAVIQIGGGRRVAAFRDEDGAVHALSPRCTHMGCTVDWNDADKTWDCPCHGSRYGTDGEVIRGPAEKALAKQDVPS